MIKIEDIDRIIQILENKKKELNTLNEVKSFEFVGTKSIFKPKKCLPEHFCILLTKDNIAKFSRYHRDLVEKYYLYNYPINYGTSGWNINNHLGAGRCFSGRCFSEINEQDFLEYLEYNNSTNLPF